MKSCHIVDTAGLASTRPSTPHWPAERGKGVTSDDGELGGGAYLGGSAIQTERGRESDSSGNVRPEVNWT